MHFFGKILVTALDIAAHTIEVTAAYVEHYIVRRQ